MNQVNFAYPGLELETFARARNWKRYVRQLVGPYLGARVLEVGAGIGSTTAALCDGSQRLWLCMEPDPRLLAALAKRIQDAELPACCKPDLATVGELPVGERFDSALYVDTLEHIADDRLEIASVAHRLAPGGYLVVLAPAHQWLYSPFDAAIGHYRRYTRRTLLNLTAAELLHPILARYVDAAGLLASLANRLVLRSANPTPRQVRLWDGVLVPLSRVMDPLLLYTLGKSVVVVWQRK